MSWKEALKKFGAWLLKNAKKIFARHKTAIYAEIDEIIDEELDKIEGKLLNYIDENIEDELIKNALKDQIDIQMLNAEKSLKENYKALIEEYLE